VDFFTPIVDDAYDFGRIAAANAFSDVYAMGATPLLALNLVGWPRDTLPYELLGEVLRGGADIAREAGAFVLGGHSVDDPEPKYGMVAIGEARPDRIVTLARARPGDVLVLTKPIGTGVLSTALKRDLATAAEVGPAVQSMITLNAGAARAMARTRCSPRCGARQRLQPPVSDASWRDVPAPSPSPERARDPRIPRADSGVSGCAGARGARTAPGSAAAPGHRICGRGRTPG